VSGTTVGGGGGVTVGVYVVLNVRDSESLAWYVTEVATPSNVGSGSKLIVPSLFTVNVPWLGIVTVTALQFGATDSSSVIVAGLSAPQRRTVDAISG
jgi:hypothetical protein